MEDALSPHLRKNFLRDLVRSRNDLEVEREKQTMGSSDTDTRAEKGLQPKIQ